VIFACQGGHAKARQFVDGRRGLPWIGRGVSDQQLEWPADDAAGVIDVADGQLESREQVSACLDPARPRERNESTDVDG